MTKPPHQNLTPFTGCGVPDGLKTRARWAPWRAVWNAKREKYDKVPHRADNLRCRLSTADPAQWFGFDAAMAALDQPGADFAGLGYCLTNPHGVIGIDLDDCVGADGVPEPWASDIVVATQSYAEISPSGRGLRIVGLGATDSDWSNHDVGIEVYGGNAARFLTITGLRLPGAPPDVEPIRPEVLEDLAYRYAKKRGPVDLTDHGMPDLLDGLAAPAISALPLPDKVMRFLVTGEDDGDRSGTLYAAGVSLYAAGLSDAEVFTALANNAHAMAVALDHRRQDRDRALSYLWREHCLKARGKGRSAVAAVDDFDVVPPADGGKPLPAFKRDGKGLIEATIENVALAVKRPDLCGMDIRFDQFRDEIMFAANGDDWRPFRDADYSRLRIRLERAGFKPIGRELIRDVVLLAADDNPFDSAILWLEGLEWDGEPRVENFLRDYFGAENSDYVRAVSTYLWTALAGRVLVPGVKADMAPILIGAQGAAKSSSVAAMAPSPEFFTEISFNEKDDDLARKMRGRLVAEIGELRGLHTRDLESIKSFIARQHENWVPKYREFATSFPRRLVFIGTTNQNEFLADETGNRRWLPVRTGRADIEAVRRDRLQLWAEGRELFSLLGVAYQTAEALAKDVHQDHTITEPWTEEIARWLNEPDTLTGEKPQAREFLQTGDVASGALRIEAKHIGKREEMRIANSLRECGFVRVQRRVNGKPTWIWVRRATTVPT